MKKLCLTILLTVFVSLTLFPQPKSLTILHTNDMHAGFTPHEAFWVKTTPKPLVGGFHELSYKVDSLRRVKENTILLDAGDVMTGHPVTEYLYRGAYGGVLFEMMNRIGYDAWSPGNHDLDISQANLQKLTAIASFPTLSSNLLRDDGSMPVNNQATAIIEKNGIRIGIIGVMSERLNTLVNASNLAGISVRSASATTQRHIDELKPNADVIIALTHQGVDDDSVLAANVRGLHVIIGGHSHTRLKQPKTVNGVLIAQAGSNCENLGILDLTVENHSVTSSSGQLLPLNVTGGRQATPLSLLIDSVQESIDKDYREVIGTLKSAWTRGSGETGIGNFIADAHREAAHADIAFMNNHGIRKNLSAGPITKRDLFEVLPFRNVLVTFPLTGKQIRAIVMDYIQRRSSIQTSGILCTWKRTEGGEVEIVSLTVGGKPVADDRTYTACASDYFVGEAERYLSVKAEQPVFLKETVFAAVETKIRKEHIIDSRIEHRIRELP